MVSDEAEADEKVQVKEKEEEKEEKEEEEEVKEKEKEKEKERKGKGKRKAKTEGTVTQIQDVLPFAFFIFTYSGCFNQTRRTIGNAFLLCETIEMSRNKHWCRII